MHIVPTVVKVNTCFCYGWPARGAQLLLCFPIYVILRGTCVFSCVFFCHFMLAFQRLKLFRWEIGKLCIA